MSIFAIAGNETFFVPVEVSIPDGTPKGKTHKFKVEFKRQTQTELKAIFRRVNKETLEGDEELLTDDQLLQDVMVGWDGVLDKNGNKVEFTPENMEALLDVYPVRPAVVGAFFASIKTAKTKN